MKLTKKEIARMMDISAVQADSTQDDIKDMVACAIKYDCIAVFTLPNQASFTRALLPKNSNVYLGGVVGFPDGGQTTNTKAKEASELVNELGCDEIDMVINIGMLRSKQYKIVEDDIRAVVEASNGKMVKVILECAYLSDDEIRKGCELCIKSGVSFVKSGTGWAPGGTSIENIKLMKSCVGDQLKVKAAGGVRTLDFLMELYKCGVSRFGISTSSAINILKECEALPNGEIEI